MQNPSLFDDGKPPDQPQKDPLRVADNPPQTISTKPIPAATESSPKAIVCLLLEDIAATQPIAQDTAKTQKPDHMQMTTDRLAEEVTGYDVIVDQDDHTISDLTMGS